MTSTSSTIKRCLVLASASFLSMTAICIILHPQIFNYPNYGISYFGSVQLTLVPYYTGFVITTICLLIVAHRLRSLEQRLLPLEIAFWVAGICMAGLAVTSYFQHDALLLFHLVLGITLTVAQLAAAVWIVTQKGSNWIDYWLLAVFSVVFVVSLVPALHSLPLLRLFPLREVIIFVCALGLIGRMALRAAPRN